VDLYLIQSNITGAFKVGRSDDPYTRVRTLQTGSPYELRIILILPNRGHQERDLHEKLRKYHTTGEWFSYEGLAELPSDIYESLDLEIVDWWWVPQN
jgi:hypothetical protein